MRIQLAAVAGLLLPLSLSAAQSTVPAWTYATNITIDSGNGSAKVGAMAIRIQTSATAIRMEIMQLSGSASGITQGVQVEGMYTLVNDVDSTFTTVMPSQRMATIMQNPVLLIGKMDRPVVRTNVSNAHVEDLGAGEKILGHPTHRFRMTSTGTITMVVNGAACTRRADGETEMWIAPDVDLGPAMTSMASHYGLELPDTSVRTASGLSMKGLPLRTKSRNVVKDANGKSRTIETTAEYVELSNAPLDASVFKVPADYRVMDMRKMMSSGMMSAAMDSVRANGAGHPPECQQ